MAKDRQRTDDRRGSDLFLQSFVTGSFVTGSRVTGSRVTGSRVTGSRVTGSLVASPLTTKARFTQRSDGEERDERRKLLADRGLSGRRVQIDRMPGMDLNSSASDANSSASDANSSADVAAARVHPIMRMGPPQVFRGKSFQRPLDGRFTPWRMIRRLRVSRRRRRPGGGDNLGFSVQA